MCRLSFDAPPRLPPFPRYHISTSFVERQNLTMRMRMRRITRLTNGFSKKVENHRPAVGLHLAHYNFVRLHRTLRATPAMAANVSSRLWSLDELVERTSKEKRRILIMSGKYEIHFHESGKKMEAKTFESFASLQHYIRAQKTADWVNRVNVHLPAHATDQERATIREMGFQSN